MPFSFPGHAMQAFFTTGVILLVEKIVLRYIAINFHRKALADRLIENRIGLKALDRLSNAEPAVKKMPYSPRRGHVSSSLSAFVDHSKSQSVDANNSYSAEKELGHARDADHSGNLESPIQDQKHHHNTTRSERHRTRKKAMASVIVDALNELAFKNSEFHKQMDLGSLSSARKLARKLFQSLNRLHPDRNNLIESDFQPYFRTTEEVVSSPKSIVLENFHSYFRRNLHLLFLTRMGTVILASVK